MKFRPIEAKDNEALARIIRQSLEEFDVPREGTVYTDPTTDQLYELFQESGSCYYVAEEEGRILGGCGIFPTSGLPTGYAELVKLYLAKESRGKGLGYHLLNHCLEAARELAYTHLYLESFPQLEQAIYLYHRLGFERLEQPLGNSGHFACTVWMTKALHA